MVTAAAGPTAHAIDVVHVIQTIHMRYNHLVTLVRALVTAGYGAYGRMERRKVRKVNNPLFSLFGKKKKEEEKREEVWSDGVVCLATLSRDPTFRTRARNHVTG